MIKLKSDRSAICYFLFSESTIYCEVSMPKIKVSDARKVRSIIKDFKEFTVTPKDELYSPLCCCIVKHEKRFFVEHHVATLKHRKGVEKANSVGTSDTR